MTTPKLASNANDIIRFYRNGETAASIGRRYNVTTTTVTSLLKKHGVMPTLKRGETDTRVVEDRRKAVQMFNSGRRPYEIMQELGRSKAWIYAQLKKSGSKLRGLDGWKPTDESVRNIVKSRQGTNPIVEAERVILSMLNDAGHEVITQLAVDRYSIDFAIHSCSVAIEVVCRGTYPAYIRKGLMRDKIKKLADSGWHTYFLIGADSTALSKHGCDDLLAWLDFSHRQKAVRRQYRVVRSPFELIATGCSDCDNLARILSPENVFKSTGPAD